MDAWTRQAAWERRGATARWERDGAWVWRSGVDPLWGWSGGILIELTPERAATDLAAVEAVSPAQHATIARFDRETRPMQRAILRRLVERLGRPPHEDTNRPLQLRMAWVRPLEAGLAPLCLALGGSRYDEGGGGLIALFRQGALSAVGGPELFPVGGGGA